MAASPADPPPPEVCDFLLLYVPSDYAMRAVDAQMEQLLRDKGIFLCTPSSICFLLEMIRRFWRSRTPSEAIVTQAQGKSFFCYLWYFTFCEGL